MKKRENQEDLPERFSGMKKRPTLGRPKVKIPPRKKPNVNYSKNTGKLSKYQMNSNEVFMKVREGETHEKWLFRTRYRRKITIDEAMTIRHRAKKIISSQAKLSIHRRDLKNRFICVLLTEKEFSHLRYFQIVTHWASVKYGIPSESLQTAIYFYNYPRPFTKEEFMGYVSFSMEVRKCSWSSFINNGYIKNIKSNNALKQKGVFELPVYTLSTQMQVRVRAVYAKMMIPDAIDHNYYKIEGNVRDLNSPTIKEVFADMVNEINDIKYGGKNPDAIITTA